MKGRRVGVFFFFKQKTAYEIVSRDWSSDVCSSDLCEVKYVIRTHEVMMSQLTYMTYPEVLREHLYA